MNESVLNGNGIKLAVNVDNTLDIILSVEKEGEETFKLNEFQKNFMLEKGCKLEEEGEANILCVTADNIYINEWGVEVDEENCTLTCDGWSNFYGKDCSLFDKLDQLINRWTSGYAYSEDRFK